jgi:hypothetical protein
MTERIYGILEGPLLDFFKKLPVWRHYLYVGRDGRVFCEAVAIQDVYRRGCEAGYVPFYRAGAWEQGFDASGRVIVKSEVLARITGTMQIEANYDEPVWLI